MMMTASNGELPAMIPAIDSPLDARPRLLALSGSDTAVLLATTVHILNYKCTR